MKNSKVILYIASSLDGYIATEDDSLEWLFKCEGEGDNGYSEFYKTIDTILIGRKTYDWIIDFEKGKPIYENKKCYVFSKTLNGVDRNIEFINEEIKPFIDKLKNNNSGNIWLVGGGSLIHYFLEEDLIDEIIVTIAPCLIGSGKPLFPEGEYKVDLKLNEIRQYNQFADLRYEVKR